VERSELSIALAKLEQMEAWLATTGENGIEVLRTVVNKGGAYHLRHFARELELRSDSGEPPHRPLKSMILNLHRSFGLATGQPGQGESETHDGGEGPGAGRLGSLFYQLLEESGLTRWQPPFFANRAANRGAIEKAIERFFIADGIGAGGLFFSDYSPFFARKASQVLADFSGRWPRGSRPYALFVAVAKQAGNGSIVVEGRSASTEVEFAGVLHRPGAVGTHGPFLVIFTFAEDAVGRLFTPMKAFAMPILSGDCWLPVESDHERRLLAPLKTLVERAVEQGRPLSLHKPMLDIQFDGEKRHVRPDVVLSWNNNRFFIEVLGSDDPEYLESKKAMGAVLMRCGDYHPIEAYRASSARQRQDQENALVARVSEWITSML
jgi:hypothetical protein